MQRLLESALRNLSFPDRGLADACATFTVQKIACSHAKPFPFVWLQVDDWKILRVDFIPSDVGIPKVRSGMFPRHLLRIHHLAKNCFISCMHGRNRPMRRHVPEPFDPGRLHWRVGVQSLGDGVGDDGLALLRQQLDQPPLLRHQRVDLRRLPVEEGGDGGLLGEGRKRDREFRNLRVVQTFSSRTSLDYVDLTLHHGRFEKQRNEVAQLWQIESDDANVLICVACKPFGRKAGSSNRGARDIQ